MAMYAKLPFNHNSQYRGPTSQSLAIVWLSSIELVGSKRA